MHVKSERFNELRDSSFAWVCTEMGGTNATRSVQGGADTAVWLADEAPHEFTEKFFRNRVEIEW
jgi:hypothetical protein